jgi:hypothetical protein
LIGLPHPHLAWPSRLPSAFLIDALICRWRF